MHHKENVNNSRESLPETVRADDRLLPPVTGGGRWQVKHQLGATIGMEEGRSSRRLKRTAPEHAAEASQKLPPRKTRRGEADVDGAAADSVSSSREAKARKAEHAPAAVQDKRTRSTPGRGGGDADLAVQDQPSEERGSRGANQGKKTKKAKKEAAAGIITKGEADDAATDWEKILSILFPHFAENGFNGLAVSSLLVCAGVCKLWGTQVDAALKCVRLLSFRSCQGRVHAADVLRVLKRMGGSLRVVDLSDWGGVQMEAKEDEDEDEMEEEEDEMEEEEDGKTSRDQALAAQQPGMQDIMRLILESLPNVTEVNVLGCSHTVVLHAVVALSSALLTRPQSDDMEEESDDMEEEEALVDFEKIRSFVASGTPRLIFDPAFVPRKDALHTAAKEGWVAWINFLTRIRVFLDIDQDDDDNRVRVWDMRSVDDDLMWLAVKNKMESVVMKLLESGAHVTKKMLRKMDKWIPGLFERGQEVYKVPEEEPFNDYCDCGHDTCVPRGCRGRSTMCGGDNEGGGGYDPELGCGVRVRCDGWGCSNLSRGNPGRPFGVYCCCLCLAKTDAFETGPPEVKDLCRCCRKRYSLPSWLVKLKEDHDRKLAQKDRKLALVTKGAEDWQSYCCSLPRKQEISMQRIPRDTLR